MAIPLRKRLRLRLRVKQNHVTRRRVMAGREVSLESIQRLYRWQV